MDWYTISIIFLILFLILLSGFFSGSETALTAVSKAKIHQLEQKYLPITIEKILTRYAL